MVTDLDPKKQALALVDRVAALRTSLRSAIVGQDALIDDLIVAVLAGGHVLIEGLPGLGKTKLVRSLGQGLGLDFSRVQFTPDLMPADVTGTTVIDDRGSERTFRFQRGPIFAGLVLADEINRATPKTQSALLEAMQEGSVTVAGTSHRLPHPFHVVATQNPIELEGTYPLPEAQLDRFMFKLEVRTPSVEAMVRILSHTTANQPDDLERALTSEDLARLQQLVRAVLCGSHLVQFCAELLARTHPDGPQANEQTRRFVRYGASARAGQAMILGAKARALLDGRAAISQQDLEPCLLPALRHRVLLGYESDASHVGVEQLLEDWKRATAKKMR